MLSIVIFDKATTPALLRRLTLSVECRECGAIFEFAKLAPYPGLTLSADRRLLQIEITEPSPWRIQ